MFGKDVSRPAALMLSIFVFVTIIETGTSYFIKAENKVDITFCRNADCSGGSEEKKEEAFFEKYQCHEINEVLRSNLTTIKIVSGPEFARCIMLYNTNNCTGESYKINGTDTDINLKFKAETDTKMNEFLRKNVSSYEFCRTHQFRVRKIDMWNNTPDIHEVVRPFMRFLTNNLARFEQLLF